MGKVILNKKCLISLGGLAITLILGFSAMHVMQLFYLDHWVGVSIGISLLVFMLIMFIILRKSITMPLTLTAIPLNAIASGIALSSMYEYLGDYPAIWQSCAVFAALVILFMLYGLLTNLSFFQNHYVICEIALVILAATSVVLGMIFSDLITFSLAAISLIPFIAMLVTMTMRSSDVVEHIKNIACCSFAVLAIVIIAVLTVITQGDGLDGFGDGIELFGGGNKKKKEFLNVYDYLPKRK